MWFPFGGLYALPGPAEMVEVWKEARFLRCVLLRLGGVDPCWRSADT